MEHLAQRRHHHQLLALHPLKVAIRLAIAAKGDRAVAIQLHRAGREGGEVDGMHVVVAVPPLRDGEVPGDDDIYAANGVNQLLHPGEIEDQPVVNVDPEVDLDVALDLLEAGLGSLPLAHPYAIGRVDPVLVFEAVGQRDIDLHVAWQAQQADGFLERVDRGDHDRVGEVTFVGLVGESRALVHAQHQQVDALVEDAALSGRLYADGDDIELRQDRHIEQHFPREERRVDPRQHGHAGVHRSQTERHEGYREEDPL